MTKTRQSKTDICLLENCGNVRASTRQKRLLAWLLPETPGQSATRHFIPTRL
jgi:hypothetical protein